MILVDKYGQIDIAKGLGTNQKLDIFNSLIIMYKSTRCLCIYFRLLIAVLSKLLFQQHIEITWYVTW